MRAAYLVFTEPIEADKEDEYNEWYNNIHIPPILERDGFVGARRYRVSSKRPAPPELAAHRYLTIYEIDHPDPATLLLRLRQDEEAGNKGDPAVKKAVLRRDPPSLTVLFEEIMSFSS
jgi:hypothetical protein